MEAEIGLLTQIIQPPKKPKGLDRSWADVEQQLGLVLPSDYKSFVDLYGSGTISDSLSIWNFRNKTTFPDPIVGILNGDDSVIQLYKLVRSQGMDIPYSMYPDPDGLLPFATYLDVHHLNWLTSGRPSEWDVVYWFSDGLEFIHFSGDSLGRFLLNCIEGSYPGKQFPKLEPPNEFTSSTRR